MILKVYLIIFLYVSLNTAVNIRSDGYCLLISLSYSCPNEYPVECVYYTCSKNRVLCDKYFMFKIFLDFDNLGNRQMKHFQSRIIKCKINKNNHLIKSDSIYNKMNLNVTILLYLSIILINILF